MPKQPTNGPYAWGNGPQPKGKGLLGKLAKKILDLATQPKDKK